MKVGSNNFAQAAADATRKINDTPSGTQANPQEKADAKRDVDSGATGRADRGSEQEKADAKRGLEGTKRAEGTSGGRAERGEQAEGGRDGVDRSPAGLNRDLMDLLNNPMFQNIPGGGRIPRG